MLGALHFYLKSKTSVFQNCANCTFTIKKQIHSCPSLNSGIQTNCIFSGKIFSSDFIPLLHIELLLGKWTDRLEILSVIWRT